MIQVLDKGFVRLVDTMGNDRRIAEAAAVSYGGKEKTDEEVARLIDYLMRHRHTSPFEQVEFVFHVKAPLFIARQWLRHRTASVNEISQRYTVVKDEFYIPTVVYEQGGAHNKQGSGGQLSDRDTTAVIHQLKAAYTQAMVEYNRLLKAGVTREQARIVLPVGVYTEFYWKMDLHNLLHFLSLRLDSHAQFEIREYAEAIAQFVQEHVPVAWASFENHVLKSVRFSQHEFAALNLCLDRAAVEAATIHTGLTEKQSDELKAKLDTVLNLA